MEINGEFGNPNQQAPIVPPTKDVLNCGPVKYFSSAFSAATTHHLDDNTSSFVAFVTLFR